MYILALVMFACAAQGLRERDDAKIAISAEFSAVAVAPAAEAAAEAAELSEISSQTVPLGTTPVEEANVAPAERNAPSEPEALLEENQRLKEEKAVEEEDLDGAAADLGRVTKQMREDTEFSDTVKEDAIIHPSLKRGAVSGVAAMRQAVARARAGSRALTRTRSKVVPRVALARAQTIDVAGIKNIAPAYTFTTMAGRGAAQEEEKQRKQAQKKKQKHRKQAMVLESAEFWSINALAVVKGDEEVATLIKSLWSTSREARIKAPRALGKLTDLSGSASLAASFALADKFQEQILTLTDEFYDPDDERAQEEMVAAGAVAEALGSLDATEKGKLALEKALDEGYWMLRLKAAEALGENGDSDSVPALARALNGDSEKRVRTAAARALGKIGDDASVAALAKAVERWPWGA